MQIVVRSAKQNYVPTDEILSLLEDFRCMVNDCIRIGLRENLTSMRSLSLKMYHKLSAYQLPVCYRLTAISRAAGILRNYRKASREHQNARIPYVKRLSLIDCYGFRIFGRLLRLPFRRGEYVFVILNGHTLEMISRREARSVTLTTSTLSISFSKELEEKKQRGILGIDRNYDNVTMATSNGLLRSIDLSETTRIKEAYRQTKGRFTRNDARVRKSIFAKYGKRERNRVNQILHRATKEIVAIAKSDNLGIVMEDLKGIRKLGRKGNGQGRRSRAKLNSWSVYEFQRQMRYKAAWEGVPVFHVSAWGTSAKCSICGEKTIPNEHRMLYCKNCNLSFDRDENAAKNILAKGLVRFASDVPPNEAMKWNPEGRRMQQVIHGADDGKRNSMGHTLQSNQNQLRLQLELEYLVRERLGGLPPCQCC